MLRNIPAVGRVAGVQARKTPPQRGLKDDVGRYAGGMTDLWTFLLGVSPILLVMLATIVTGGIVLITRRRH